MDCRDLRVRKHYRGVYALQLHIVEMYAVIIIVLASYALRMLARDPSSFAI